MYYILILMFIVDIECLSNNLFKIAQILDFWVKKIIIKFFFLIIFIRTKHYK